MERKALTSSLGILLLALTASIAFTQTSSNSSQHWNPPPLSSKSGSKDEPTTSDARGRDFLPTVTAASQTVIHFDELSPRPVNGVNLFGVTFAFTLSGIPSADAFFNTNAGPGSSIYFSPPDLEGNALGTLTLTFDAPVGNLSFAIARETFTKLNKGVSVELFDETNKSLKNISLDLPLVNFFPQGRFSYSGTPAKRAVITFPYAGTAPRFAIDDLTFDSLPTPDAFGWARTYGDVTNNEVSAIMPSADGQGYIAVGITETFGDKDILVLKLGINGQIIWRRSLGGGQADSAAAGKPTFDGGAIVVGTTSSFGAGAKDIWVIKLDANGRVEWQHTYGGRKDDIAADVELSSDGGYVIAATTSSFGSGSKNILALKLNADGSLIWQRTNGRTLRQDTAYSIRSTSDGKYVIAGTTEESLLKQITLRGLLLTIDDSTGVPTGIEQTYSFISFFNNQTRIFGIQPNATGFLITGNRQGVCPPHPDIECFDITELWVAQLDPYGTPIWTKTLRAGTSASGSSIVPTSDGGFIVAGSATSALGRKGLAVKFNSQGGDIWQKIYGDQPSGITSSISSSANSFINSSPIGGYILACTSFISKGGQTQGDFLIMKLDVDGAINLSCLIDQNASYEINNADLSTGQAGFDSDPTNVTVQTPNAATIGVSGTVQTKCQQ